MVWYGMPGIAKNCYFTKPKNRQSDMIQATCEDSKHQMSTKL